MDILLYAVSFVVAVGTLVVVHEFGHFWVAKKLGVKVLRFSVGFGKPLWTKRIGPDRMELVVAAVPLGGYVKMLDETEGDVPAKERKRAFNRQPVWKRVLIVVAGPAFNFIFAILAYWLVFATGIDGLRPVVGHVVEGSIAQKAGFQKGDEILAMDARPVMTWDQRRLYLFERALDREPVKMEVRDPMGRIQMRTLDLSNLPVQEVNAGLVERSIGLLPYRPEVLPVIGMLEEGPAKRAGFEVGDRFVRIDGQPIASWEEAVAAINAKPGRSISVDVERNGERRTLEVTPAPVEVGGKTIGRISIRPRVGPIPDDMRTAMKLSPGQALTEALADTWSMSVLTLEMLYRMLRLEISTETISGPLTIAQYAGVSAKIGFSHFIMFLAVISISLGVLNLLPIPVLDGGHLLYYIIEFVKGGPLSEQAMM
ncbi:MAG TPA: RIP metalloprotease RseP, partial [Burkholderiales bacterium]|nr:RIP metalloprotease RseP [Burkholderiales bacterium]